MLRYAVIPTHNRPDDYAECVAAITPQVDGVITIAHRCDYALAPSIEYDAELPNISVMWNLGLDAAEREADGDPFQVAVLNDDAIVPSDWVESLSGPMYQLGAAGASGPRGPGSLKIAGYAFILDGTKGIRANERLQWWYGDDQIQRDCEERGGFAIVPHVSVEHRYPSASTVDLLAEQARRDRVTYREGRNAS